jgi:hypothetical protein
MQTERNWLGRTLWGVAAVLSVAVAIVSFRYLPRIGPLAPNVVANLFARPFLDIHVAGAATALLLLPVQMLAGVRARFPRVHRWTGRVYVLGCLVGGVGGLVMAFGATAGPWATAGFGSLALCWIVANVQGWRTARARQFGVHRQWMIRSFALTFGAVMLRLYLPVFIIAGVPFMEGYRATAFLSWIPNLILAELYLRRRPSPSVPAANLTAQGAGA